MKRMFVSLVIVLAVLVAASFVPSARVHQKNSVMQNVANVVAPAASAQLMYCWQVVDVFNNNGGTLYGIWTVGPGGYSWWSGNIFGQEVDGPCLGS